MRSVMSGISALWSSIGLSSTSSAKADRLKAAEKDDLKYLYSAFTKVPCLRLAPDHNARLISGYEEFPFDSAVPLFAFKNLSALEIYDVDFRQFFGWDRLAEQLKSLIVKRAGVDDPLDLLVNIVLDDADRRRRRSAKVPTSPITPWPMNTLAPKPVGSAASDSPPETPVVNRRNSVGSPGSLSLARGASYGSTQSSRARRRSVSPNRPTSSRHGSAYTYGRNSTPNLRRSSGSSNSSVRSNTPRGSSSNLLTMGLLSPMKWRFLRHLSLADNGLTQISAASLAPLAETLHSLDISSNLFTEIPDSLATLTSLRALNLANCMITSLHSLARNPLPAITTLNLRGNRLTSLAGIDRLYSLERVDFRDNRLTDPTELARLTSIPEIREIFVNKNPFVKTHSNYRVIIFNLFRKTPGYTEDVILDTTPPGYSERKQLIDRVPEMVGVPVIRPPPEDISPPPTATASPPKETPPQDPFIDTTPQRRPSYPASGDYPVQSRKRKTPRRRIVELSKNEPIRHVESESAVASALYVRNPPTDDSTYGGSTDNTPTRTRTLSDQPPRLSSTSQPPELTPLDTSVAPPLLRSATENLSETTSNLNINGDLYRKKIEALRSDFGSSWLSAMGEDSWDKQPNNYSREEIGTISALRPSPSARTPSQSIVSGGRTLG